MPSGAAEEKIKTMQSPLKKKKTNQIALVYAIINCCTGHFFIKLNGQVFILSTNEEINSSHVKLLERKIAATYMLENTDNKKTIVLKNSYFEV